MTDTPNILLIDDDQDFCSAVKTFFDAKGLSIATISDPTAVPLIDFRRFKVAFLDLDMPIVTGREIVCQIPNNQRPLIIIVSGHSDIDTRTDLLNEGADFFVTKPVDLKELYLIAKRALGRTDALSSHTGDWILSQSSMSITTPDENTFGLSSSEFRVLETLFKRAPEPASKTELVEVIVAGRVDTYNIRTLEVMLSRMRKRFSSETASLPIKSLRNVGYIFHGNGKVVD